MAIAPFIRPIRVQGGTFYTFPSCIEDLNFTFTNPTYSIVFSKFVALNIPDVATPDNNQNYIQFRSIPGAFSKVYDTSTNPNIALAESFQNYALNLESMIISDENYDSNSLRTVSERVFFKWLKEIGAIRFREANSTETSTNNTNIGQRFVEEDESSIYTRVVKYIGEIDITNTSKYQGNTQAEIYMHFPTETGSSPHVLFTSETKDLNYGANAIFTNKQNNPLNSQYILGRTSESIHPSNLDFRAYFDSEGSYQEATYQLSKKDETGNYVNDLWWWNFAENNSYFLEPTRLNDPRNDDFKIQGLGSSAGIDVYFRRSRLDGIGLDFNLLNYQQAVQLGVTNTWNNFNKTPGSTTFDFNAIMVYYDIVSQSDPSNKTTNLYGILFLDDVQQSTEGAFIPRMTKYKPDPATNINGNSYGIRLNLRLDSNVEDSSVTQSINDYNTFSMQLFSDALSQLSSATDLLVTQIADVNSVKKELSNMEDIMLKQDSLTDLETRVSLLEQNYLQNQAMFNNTNTIMKLINRNYSEILNIYNNKTSVTVQYNTDILKPGTGISITKSGGNVFITNDREGYNYDYSKPYIDLQEYNPASSGLTYTYKLVNGINYVLLKTTDSSIFEPNADLVLFIDDSENTFDNGQVIKVCISTPINLSKNSTLPDRKFTILTDSKNRSGSTGPYNVLIGSINSTEFSLSGNTPYFEIVCLNKDNYVFNIEKIR